MFTLYENLLPNDIFQNLYSNLRNRTNWAFTNTSLSKEDLNKFQSEDDIVFWTLPLNEDTIFTEILLDKINEVTQKKFKIIRVYANGQSHGQSGDLHADDLREDAYTFLYYVNPVWNLKWGGATVFY